jgi:hypothetical protein
MHTAASTEANLKNEVQDLKEKLTLTEANLKTQVHYLKDKLTSKEANLQNQVQYLKDMLGLSEDKVKTLTGQLEEEMALSIVVIEAAKEQRAREEQLKDMLVSSEDKAMTLTGQLEQLQAAIDKARKEADEYATRLQEEMATSKALLSEAAEELRAREEHLTEALQRQGEAASQLKAARQELELLAIRNGFEKYSVFLCVCVCVCARARAKLHAKTVPKLLNYKSNTGVPSDARPGAFAPTGVWRGAPPCSNASSSSNSSKSYLCAPTYTQRNLENENQHYQGIP